MNIDGKVVAITGAGRGIGQEYALALGKAGARIVLADIGDCDATSDLLKAQDTQFAIARFDVRDAAQSLELAATATRTFGRLDALVNNAALYGALRGGKFDSISEEDWDATMAVNVKGMWNCCKATVPLMRAAGGGSIVNIASLAATYGMPYALHYTTSKAAVIGLTRGLARELGRENIRVNAIAPSLVMTEGTQEFFGGKHDKAVEAVRAAQAIPRSLVPSDLVGTVLWLISDGSIFVTGQTISVDGGTVLS